MSAIRNYAVVTASYWGFTLTDGALRMLVLLHFYQLGYTPFTLAMLFLLYETAGIFANLGGGWLASRFGIPVSTTHTITGAIIGVGATNRLSAVRWGLASKIVWAWVITIPAAAAMAAIAYKLLAAFNPL